MRIKIGYKQYEALIISIFIMFLIVYGRSLDYDGAAVERNLVNIEETSKAPFLIGTTFFLFFLTKKEERFNFENIVNFKLWLAFFVVTFCVIFFQVDFVGSIKKYGTILFSYTLFFYLIKFAYKIPYNKLESLFVYTSFGILLLCVIFHISQGKELVLFPARTDIDDNYNRLGGMFYYAHTAAIAGITFIFAIKKLKEDRKFQYYILSLISLILLVATDTRSAWFSVIVSLGFLFFERVKFNFLFTLAVVFYVCYGFIADYIGEGTTLSSADEDSEYRKMIWAYSLEIANENLFVGYGSVNPLIATSNPLSDYLQDPHNSLLSLLLQSGLMAVVIYIIMFLRNCKECLTKYNKSYRFLFFYWAFFPFFWGHLYNNVAGFIQLYILFTIYAFALNPSSRKINVNSHE